jgi:probable HAF family extracellular repeat protein
VRTHPVSRSLRRALRSLARIGIAVVLVGLTASSHVLNVQATPSGIAPVDLGTLLGVGGSKAEVINSLGQIAGASDLNASGTAVDPFFWTQSGGMIDMGSLSASNSTQVYRLNDAGQALASGGSIDSPSVFWSQSSGPIVLRSADGSSLSSTGNSLAAFTLNNHAQVVGYYATPFNTRYAFTWSPDGGLITLTPSDRFAMANLVNDNGQVAGIVQHQFEQQHGFSWTAAGGLVDIGTLFPGRMSAATGLNDAGQIVGYSQGNDGSLYPFIWTSSGGMVQISSQPLDSDGPNVWITNSGFVAGDFKTPDGHVHPFRWTQQGGMVDLGTLGGNNADIATIDDSGEIIGESDTADGHTHGYAWTASGGMVDIGTLPGATSSFAFFLTNSGIVAGSSGPVNGQEAFFAWTAATGIVRLESLPGPSHISDMNDQGQIVGTSAGRATLWNAGVLLNIDSTPPNIAITHTADGANGWNGSSPVTETVQASDADSGLASGSPSCTVDSNNVALTAAGDGTWTLQVSGDGTHAIACTATDNATNTATASDAVMIDRQAPTISGRVTPAANSYGWNNSSVTVTFDCNDGGSGIARCPSPTTFGEGANQSISGTATDVAGNSASVTVSGINVDGTKPILAGSATTNPSANGWYDGDVTIHWTCSDALSGIIAGSCPPNDTISGEGIGLTQNESVTDKAGNVTSATSAPVKIDQTPPVTTATTPSNWSTHGVTVPLTATDNLSGVAATYYMVDGGPPQLGTSVQIDMEGIHTLNFWSLDAAGNSEMMETAYVKIEKTAPTITHLLSPSANAAGWNNTAVTVTFTCGSSLSGVASCTGPQTVTGEGQSQPMHGTVVDNAGLSATDTAFVSIDETAPAISADRDRAANTYGWFNAPVKVSFTCNDSLSGIASCPTAITVGQGANQTITGTAVDNASNNASTSMSGINVDSTPPLVSYSGNQGSYTVNQTITITCAASDSLSGIASTTCQSISGPAYSFGLGTTSLSASATDRAGNTATASTSFSVVDNASGLDALIEQTIGAGGAANGLETKVAAIVSAPNQNAKNGKIGAFDNQVDALVHNGTLTEAEAAVLKQLAGAL